MSTQTVDPPSSATTPIRKPGETQRLQTVCIEIPIIVQGSRNSHPPQPFLEETRTVIVFPHGAVLRLTEVVTAGQIVIIQNMRLKQEVACRVTSSKPSASVKGYVEVEFTQPTPGFWGIGFPGEAITQRNEVTAPVAPVAAQLTAVAPTPVPPPSVRPVNGQPSIAQPPIAQPIKESRVEVAPVAPAKIEAPAPQVKKPTPEDTLALNRAIVAAFASQPPKPAPAAPKKAEIVESVQAPVEKVAEAPAAPVAQATASAVQEEVAPTPVPVEEVIAAPLQVAPPAPAPIAVKPVTVAPAVPVAPSVVTPPAATQKDSGKLSEAIRENVRENLSNKARDEAREDLRSARQFEVAKPVSPAAPISLAESLDPSNAAAPSIAIPRTPVTSSKPFSKKAKKEKESFDKQTAAFAEHSGVQVAEAKLFGHKTERTLNSAAPSNKMKIIAIAAVLIVMLAGGGVFGYRWYSRSQGANSVIAATKTPAAPTATNPGTTVPVNSNVTGQPTTNPAAPGAIKNSPVVPQQKAPGSVTNSNPSGTKPTNSPVNVPQQRRQSSLPMNIAAPKAPSASAANGGQASSPELNLQTPPSNIGNGQTISLGSISSLPAPPPASRGSAPAPVNSSASTFVAPKLLTTSNPVYPKMALVRGDQGDVTVTAMVNEQGKVYNAKAISGPPTLREAAVDAVSMYRYEPGKLNGRIVTSVINVTIKFKR